MRKDLGDHLLEITRRTEALAGRSVGSAIACDEISRLGISVPLVRRAVKRGYAFVSDSPSENLVVWDYIWRHSACYEVMHQALYFYQHRQLNREETQTIRGWMDRCTGWEHCDDLSKIYATVVEANPKWLMPTLKRWNRSDNPWKRRGDQWKP